jgi:signal transduction histidine kinase
VIRPDYTPHARAERLIAAGRFVLAFFSLVAIYLEPSTPAKFQRPTYALLAIYTLYALVVVFVAWRLSVPSRRWRLLSHAADLVLFTLFVYLTEGPASPFFLYFVFSLFCATLRFSWRGILATGIAAIVIYAFVALIAFATDPHFELSRTIVREAYLAVIAALLVYLGLYQERLRSELASLAAWPRELASDLDDLLRVTLAHAAGVLQTRRVLLLWEETEEPWRYVADWSDGNLQIERIAPDAPDPFADIVAPISVPLQSETLAAQLVIPSRRNATADDITLAHIAGRLVLATLDQFFFMRQVRQTASAEERLRISRDLHDGIVQSLGGVGLQLQAIRTQLDASSPAAERIAHVQRVLEHDQRELRTIVRELRPHDAREGQTILRDELARMRERFALEWGLDVDVHLAPRAAVPAPLAQELCRIVNESLSNAARHGGASHASVRIASNDGTVDVRVADDGRGFPFRGRYDLGELARSGQGPRTLRERIVTLGGTLTVESTESGAAIEARLPLTREGGA